MSYITKGGTLRPVYAVQDASLGVKDTLSVGTLTFIKGEKGDTGESSTVLSVAGKTGHVALYTQDVIGFDEAAQDAAAQLFANGTHTRITVTYNDATGKIDLAVSDQFTNLGVSGSLTLSGGTANAIPYLNASKVVTSGSALTFDGSIQGITTTANGGLRELLRLSNNGSGDGTSAQMTFYAATTNYAQITGGYIGAPALIGNVAIGGYHAWQVNSSEQMRLTPAGLGYKVVPSVWGSGVAGFQVGAWTSLSSANAYGTGLGFNNYFDGTNHVYGLSNVASKLEMIGGFKFLLAPSGTAGNSISFIQAMDLANASGASTLTVNSAINSSSAVRLTTDGGVSAGIFLANASADHSLGFQTSGTEKARFSSIGDFLVGTTTASSSVTNGFTVTGATGITALGIGHVTGSGSGTNYIVFNYNGSAIGSITQSGTTATAYNTSSDYRLKNVTGPITDSGRYIDSLKPVEGTWKADGSVFVGLIAHEVQEASRTQVATGSKDGELMQAMDYSSSEIIANLIAEAQAIRRRVADLESIH